jgi:nucleotide-binding universal stress UspA family protein
MIEFERILVPLDFSPSAQHALSVAVCFSRHFGSCIDLLHVLDGVTLDEQMTQLEERLDRLVPMIPSDVRHLVRVRLDSGDPAERICAMARKLEENLIVMGRRGFADASETPTGNVTARVKRNAHCVVICVDADNPVEAFDLMNLAMLHAARQTEPRGRATGS